MRSSGLAACTQSAAKPKPAEGSPLKSAAAATRNREADKKDRKAQLLMTLQAASLNGLDALKAAFDAEPDDADRAEVWHEHSMTLKRAAKAAGEQAA